MQAARALDRNSPLPLWAQLYDDLVRRLAAGAFSAAFPGEHELVAEYEVSRHTVREALSRLRRAGVLDSARGRRTEVRRARIDQPLGALYSLFREVEARGMRQRSEVLANEVRSDPAVATRLGRPTPRPSSTWSGSATPTRSHWPWTAPGCSPRSSVRCWTSI